MRRELTERARVTAADVRAHLERIRHRHNARSGWHLERLEYPELVRLRALVLKGGGCEMHAGIDIVEAELQTLSRLAAVADTTGRPAFDVARLSPLERMVFAEIESRATGAKEKSS